ncbi:MAG TPA: response regulator transcription factor [Bryobacteraceae bacterium]|nr:response regulator transcription factor [Bryobacteraceae bacterium]
MTTRILVVDDHRAVGRGVQDILRTELGPVHCEIAGTLEEAVSKLQVLPWEAAIVDLNLPGRGGLELVEHIRQFHPRVRILVYTMHSEEELGVRALRAGADGYLTKDRAPEDLGHAVRKILSGARYISPALADELVERVIAHKEDAHDSLSNREHQILRAIAQGKSPTQIAEELSLSIKTVSTYRTRVMEKLSLANTSELIRYAIKNKLAD